MMAKQSNNIWIRGIIQPKLYFLFWHLACLHKYLFFCISSHVVSLPGQNSQ